MGFASGVANDGGVCSLKYVYEKWEMYPEFLLENLGRDVVVDGRIILK